MTNQTGQPYPYSRFTEHARKVLKLAEDTAIAGSFTQIGATQILLAIIDNMNNMGHALLRKLVAEPNKWQSLMAYLNTSSIDYMGMKAPVGTPPTGLLELTRSGRTTIEQAIKQAEAHNHAYIGPEHLLLGCFAALAKYEALASMELWTNYGLTEARILTELELIWFDNSKRRRRVSGEGRLKQDLEVVIGRVALFLLTGMANRFTPGQRDATGLFLMSHIIAVSPNHAEQAQDAMQSGFPPPANDVIRLLRLYLMDGSIPLTRRLTSQSVITSHFAAMGFDLQQIIEEADKK